MGVIKYKRTVVFAVALMFCFGANGQFWDFTDPQKLGGTVNSTAEESIPVFSLDSSMLYFVRTYDEKNTGGKYDQDVWVSRKDADGGYSNCTRVGELNNKLNNAILGFDQGGTEMYLLNAYEGKKDTKKGIAVSSLNENKWGTPVSIKIPELDIDGDYYGFHMGKSRDVIIISYIGEESLGAEDLYVSTKNNGEWSAPIHMGNVLNTSGYEIAPFLSTTGDTLFFSSTGHGGYGSCDIFYSIKGKSWTDWSTPKNLGERINSPKFDAYFMFSGRVLFGRVTGMGELSDIFTMDILSEPPPPPIRIACVGIDASLFGQADGKIDLTVEGGVPPYTYNWTNGSHVKNLVGLKKGTYSVEVIDAIGQHANCEVIINQPKPLDLTVVVELNEIKFDLNKSTIRPDAAKELDKIVEILNDNPKMVIELGAHTDCRGSAAYNQKLSQKRAKSSAMYIKERITTPERISYKGYGESRLLNDCACEGNVVSECSDEEHAENRRTEFKIIEIGSENVKVRNNSNNSFD